MYLKLAIRNAKRSILDYLLYIFSMIMLISVICLSNHIANWGNIQAGFETMALPTLVVIIMGVLADYINTFLVKQRTKEFATYLLLGMEKSKLSLVFLCELSVIGLVCFLLGIGLGTGIFSGCYLWLLHGIENQSLLQVMLKSILQTFVYFCGVELLSILFMRRKLYKLQIIQLMEAKRRNQPMNAARKSFWGRTLIIGFMGYVILLYSAAFAPEPIMDVSISLLSLPMLLCVYGFYKWLYAFMISLRLSQRDALYQGSKLYTIAEMTTGSATGANINTVFCICLIFSALSFVFGILLLQPDFHIFEQTRQQWMGFLQINICIIFMVIYFSILSLLQIIDLKREAEHSRLLLYLGQKRVELKTLLRIQILVKLFLPTFMAFVLLLSAAFFVNHKLNGLLPKSMCNFTLKALGLFLICFFAFYVCYFCVINRYLLRYKIFNMK